jgi:chromate transporter
VLWPQGFAGVFEWQAALIDVAAAIALLRYKRGVMEVIAACAVSGLMLQTLLQ